MHYQSLHILPLSLLFIVLVLPFTSPSPQAWRPQGRFGKRAAWRPQSRFGKRPSGGVSALLPNREDGPKRAWRPSSRFGKREDETAFEDQDMMKRAWKPQGRFGKREDEGMDVVDLGPVDVATEEDLEKRAWKPQGRFGKRLLRTQKWRSVIESLKRAWKPQGRFGKRSNEETEDEAEMMVSGDDVMFDRKTGETCIKVMSESGPVFKCFRGIEADEEPVNNNVH